MKVYLDNCTFNRPYDDQVDNIIYLESEAKLFIQEMIKQGEIELIWSYMLTYENSHNPDPDIREKIENWSELAVATIIESSDIISLGSHIVKLGIKSKDALHIACAIEGQADIFVTTDKGILKKRDRIANLKIVNPLEYLLWEKKT